MLPHFAAPPAKFILESDARNGFCASNSIFSRLQLSGRVPATEKIWVVYLARQILGPYCLSTLPTQRRRLVSYTKAYTQVHTSSPTTNIVALHLPIPPFPLPLLSHTTLLMQNPHAHFPQTRAQEPRFLERRMRWDCDPLGVVR